MLYGCISYKENCSKMNLYIFNKTRRGAVYGVGTYISELTGALQTKGIKVCVINLFSEVLQVYKEEMNGIGYL